MISPAALGLLLRADLATNTDAMVDLIRSGDLVVVNDDDTFGLRRAPGNEHVTRLEVGNSLVLPMATA